jgi:pteridine reductase
LIEAFISIKKDSMVSKNKNALITGGARRLGSATALALAEKGINLLIHFNESKDEALKNVKAIEARGVKAWALQADLSKSGSADALLEEAYQLAGPIDYLINNASIFQEDTILELTEKSLSENLRINTLAPFELARGLAKEGRQGVIINFLDTRILDYDRTHASYHLSKRLFGSLTRMMALEFAPILRVNAVAPGLILPPPGKGMDDLEKMSKDLPLKAYGNLEDITSAVLFLLENPFITGQVIYVDGGRHLRGNIYHGM